MSDFPLQALLQQSHTRSESGEHLEVLGKRASAGWINGEYKTLTDAVTDTVKQAHLSPEQVRRVVEFANTDAYLKEFKKEGAAHHIVNFSGGPADPSAIIQDLNDGGGGSVFDTGTGDYNTPPSGEKTASAEDESALAALFGSSVETPLPYENPHGEVIELRDKLAGANDLLLNQISGLEVMYAELGDRMYHQVKQAALSGVSMGEVAEAWQYVAPTDEHVKVAFGLVTPRLLNEGVFRNVEEMLDSAEKTAGAKVANPEHPLLVEFAEFCDALTKMAELRSAREELKEHLGHLNNYLKAAAAENPAALQKAWKAVKDVGAAGGKFVGKHTGSETAGKLVEHGLPLAAAAVPVAVAADINQRLENKAMQGSLPAKLYTGPKHYLQRITPGTQRHEMARQGML